MCIFAFNTSGFPLKQYIILYLIILYIYTRSYNLIYIRSYNLIYTRSYNLIEEASIHTAEMTEIKTALKEIKKGGK